MVLFADIMSLLPFCVGVTKYLPDADPKQDPNKQRLMKFFGLNDTALHLVTPILFY